MNGIAIALCNLKRIEKFWLMRRYDIALNRVALFGEHGDFEEIATVYTKRIATTVDDFIVYYLEVGIQGTVVLSYHIAKT